MLDERALGHRVIGEYPLSEVESCRFLCRGDSDIYRVATKSARFYAKVYRPPHTKTHAESEAGLVEHLAQAGIPVVRAIRRRDGRFASEARASEGPRPILLFEEAPPGLPEVLSQDLMRAFGATVARFHDAVDGQHGVWDLPVLDLDSVVEELVPSIRTFASEEEWASVLAIVDALRPELAGIAREAPDWGVCHADLVTSNARSSRRDGVTLFDFGNVSVTYRGLELAVVQWSLGHRDVSLRQGLWAAFEDGYAELRPLPAALEQRMPLFLILRELSFLGGNAATLPHRLGTEPFETDFLSRGLARIQAHWDAYRVTRRSSGPPR